jgi:hypothetical protein
MHPAVREFYNLEEVWGGKRVRVGQKVPAKPKAVKKRATAARPRRKR